MSHTYQANVLGALGVVLGDRLVRAGAAGSAAEALVMLEGGGPGITIDALARRVGLSHSGGVRLVDRLVQQEMVERRKADDLRATALGLTPEGRRTARRILARREVEMEALLALLTDDQQGELVRLVERLLALVGSTGADAERICRLCDRDACGHVRGDCPVKGGRDPITET